MATPFQTPVIRCVAHIERPCVDRRMLGRLQYIRHDDPYIQQREMNMTRREKLEQMLEKSPQDVFLNFGLAMELAKEGRIDEALAQFDHVIRIDPSYLTAYFQKGSTLIHAKRIPDARAVLTAGIAAARTLGDSHTESEMQGMLDGIV